LWIEEVFMPINVAMADVTWRVVRRLSRFPCRSAATQAHSWTLAHPTGAGLGGPRQLGIGAKCSACRSSAPRSRVETAVLAAPLYAVTACAQLRPPRRCEHV